MQVQGQKVHTSCGLTAFCWQQCKVDGKVQHIPPNNRAILAPPLPSPEINHTVGEQTYRPAAPKSSPFVAVSAWHLRTEGWHCCRQAAGGEQEDQPELERARQCDLSADRCAGRAGAHPLPGLQADAHPGRLPGRQLQNHHDGHRLPCPGSLPRSVLHSPPAILQQRPGMPKSASSSFPPVGTAAWPGLALDLI